MQRRGSLQARRVSLRRIGAWVWAGLLMGGGLVGGRAEAQSPTLTTLYSFSALSSSSTNAEGAEPEAALVQGSDGSFYGTTPLGGANNQGSVFKITPTGTLTTLYVFSGGADGGTPLSSLVQGTDGNFYGTTVWGGINGQGTVFQITPAGALTTLYSFQPIDPYGVNTDGAEPFVGLVQGRDGNFYGTANTGGGSGLGTVFRITPAGNLTTLHVFSGSDGSYPRGVLVQGTDGNFYGTTVYGGTNDQGTVFQITPTGTQNTLYSFSGTSDGAQPQAGLVQGSDGNFYGTTSQGGANNQGTVLEITPTGTLTLLHSFSGQDGGYPLAGLVQGGDGNFYGTTNSGGTNGSGTVFKTTSTGTLTTLHAFSGSDGALPWAGLIQGNGGSFYGTTSQGGANNQGTVFSLAFAAPSSIQLTNVALSRKGKSIQATVTLKNSTSQVLNNSSITVSTLNGAATTSKLPVKPVKSLAPGGTVNVSLTFPGSAGAPGTTVTLVVSGIYTGGTFTASKDVTLP